jgi:hypothetical protein
MARDEGGQQDDQHDRSKRSKEKERKTYEDTVGVDVKGDLDLGNTSRGRGDTGELELSEEVVVLSSGSLSLEDLDEDSGLVVGVGGEDLGLLGGNGGVSC